MMKTAAFISSALVLIAQQPAAIQGVLTDSSGAAIPGVAVSLSGAGIQKTVQTAFDGSYSFPGLSFPGFTTGDYTLKVDYAGLEEFEERVTAQAGRTLQVPIQLRSRVSTKAVTVTGDRGPELSLDPSGIT